MWHWWGAAVTQYWHIAINYPSPVSLPVLLWPQGSSRIPHGLHPASQGSSGLEQFLTVSAATMRSEVAAQVSCGRPWAGKCPIYFIFFFSVRWESLVMEEDSPLLTSHTGPHHPHDLSLGVMAGLPARPPLHRAPLSLQEERDSVCACWDLPHLQEKEGGALGWLCWDSSRWDICSLLPHSLL